MIRPCSGRTISSSVKATKRPWVEAPIIYKVVSQPPPPPQHSRLTKCTFLPLATLSQGAPIQRVCAPWSRLTKPLNRCHRPNLLPRTAAPAPNRSRTAMWLASAAAALRPSSRRSLATVVKSPSTLSGLLSSWGSSASRSSSQPWRHDPLTRLTPIFGHNWPPVCADSPLPPPLTTTSMRQFAEASAASSPIKKEHPSPSYPTKTVPTHTLLSFFHFLFSTLECVISALRVPVRYKPSTHPLPKAPYLAPQRRKRNTYSSYLL